MALGPYEPLRQLSNIRREFDRFFSDLPIAFDHEHSFGGIRTDIHETDCEVVATFDIPGLEKKRMFRSIWIIIRCKLAERFISLKK